MGDASEDELDCVDGLVDHDVSEVKFTMVIVGSVSEIDRKPPGVSPANVEGLDEKHDWDGDDSDEEKDYLDHALIRVPLLQVALIVDGVGDVLAVNDDPFLAAVVDVFGESVLKG